MRKMKMDALFPFLQSRNIYLLLLLIVDTRSQDLDWEKLDFDIFLKESYSKTNFTQSNAEAKNNTKVKLSIHNNKYSNNNSLTHIILENDEISNVISRINSKLNGEKGEIISTYENDNNKKVNEVGIRHLVSNRTNDELISSYSSIYDAPQQKKRINKRNGGKRKRKSRKRQKRRRKISKQMKQNKSSLNNWLPLQNGIRSSIENENEEMIGVFKVKRKEITFASPLSKRNDQMNERSTLKRELGSTTLLNNEIKERSSVSVKTKNTFPLKKFVNNQSDKYDEEKASEMEKEFVGSSFRNTYVTVPLHYPFSDNIYSSESLRQFTVSNTIRKDPAVVNGEVIWNPKLLASSDTVKPVEYVASIGERDYSVLPSDDVTLTSKYEMKKGKKIQGREYADVNSEATPTSIDSRNKIPKYNSNKISETRYESSIPKDLKSGPNDKRDVSFEFANQIFYVDENPYILQEPFLRISNIYKVDGSRIGQPWREDPSNSAMTDQEDKMSKMTMAKNSLKRQINAEILAGMTASRPSLSYTNPKSTSESQVHPSTFDNPTGKRVDNPQPSFVATFSSNKSVSSEKGKKNKIQKIKDRKNVNAKSRDSGMSEKGRKSSIGNRKETGKYKENGQIFQNENFGEERNGNQEEIKRKLKEERGIEERDQRMGKAERALPTNDISLKEKKAIKNTLSSKPQRGKTSTPDPPNSFHSPPTLATIPKTSFNCRGKLTGYYADPKAACQVFHRCQSNGRQDSFLCPKGTLFNQQLLTCDYYGNVDCRNFDKLYYAKKISNKEANEIEDDFVNSKEQKLPQKFLNGAKETFYLQKPIPQKILIDSTE